jgi:hypothetical protein
LLAIPLAPIRAVINALGDVFRCGGCGCETYYGDDWCFGHRCCEPCDNCGNYVGGCGGCGGGGRCGLGGLGGLLFGGCPRRGVPVSDGTVVEGAAVNGTVPSGDVMLNSQPSNNVAHANGVCPNCGRSYATGATVTRNNPGLAGPAASRAYAANAGTNVRYNSGNSTASYRGQNGYNSNPNYTPATSYPATRTGYVNNAQTPSPQFDLSSLPAGRFSPKVISVTDEVVSPAGGTADNTQAARPRDMPIR